MPLRRGAGRLSRSDRPANRPARAFALLLPRRPAELAPDPGTDAAAGQLAGGLVGLSRWLEAGQSNLAAEQAALAANAAPLDSLAELRGRLSSLRAKARAYTLRGAPHDPALESLAMEAERLLTLLPAPLSAATSAFQAYEKRLNLVLQSSASPESRGTQDYSGVLVETGRLVHLNTCVAAQRGQPWGATRK